MEVETQRLDPDPAPADLDLAHLRARARHLLDLTPVEPVRVGRFTVVERIGMGGMGVVYLAYDPELDRRVAVKMLRPDASGGAHAGGRERMLREAQAMARLAHPNVLPVYDVGQVDERVYLAVEYVDGTTLRKWLARPRTWKEVLEVFVQAGRGLAAAHNAGLVHRDFKPSNVLVGNDGRVRVFDFGLARSSGDEPEDTGDAVTTREAGQSAPSRSFDDPITEVGTVLGTPAYMSPEQQVGDPADAASDQFAFCVALYEALCGHRPFGDEGADEASESRVLEFDKSTKVPARVRRAVIRGLSQRREHRFPKMDALLAELGTGPRAASWWWVGGAAMVAAVLGGMLLRDAPGAGVCADPSARLEGIWDTSAKSMVQAAFDRSELPYAADAWQGVERGLDERAREWAQAYDGTCADAADGRETEELHLERTLCLEWRLQEMRALIGVFGEVDPDVLEHAVEAVEGLPGVDACSAERVAQPQVRPPAEPERREQVQASRIELAGVQALRHAGKYEEALAAAGPPALAAADIGYAPLEADWQVELGALQAQAGDMPTAETTLLGAIELGTSAGYDEATARAWVQLVDLVGDQQARLEEARRLCRLARGPVEKLVDATAARADLWRVEGTIARLQGNFDEAVELHTKALNALEAGAGGQTNALAEVHSALALTHRDAGQIDAALNHARAARDITERTRGEAHPDVSLRLSALASILRGHGDDEHVLELFQEALAIHEATIGPDHPQVAGDLHNVASTLGRQGQHAQALPYYERALAIDERTAGDDLARIAPTLYELGMALSNMGRPEEGRVHLQRALEIAETALGPEHHNVAYPLIGLGTLAFADGNRGEGHARFERALEIIDKRLGKAHPRYLLTVVDYGAAMSVAGEPQKGLTLLETALTLADEVEMTPFDRASIRFRIAGELDRAGYDAIAVEGVARAARDSVAGTGAPEGRLRTEIDEWLSHRGEKK